MNKIKVLAPDQAQKIAAGEVIERPVNVVKEIIENSIDAGASQISLYIEKAGKQLIRVVDNGCGMSVTDAKSCFLSHATSKITRLEELESIDSYGFRGEALASISAISKIKLITRLNQEDITVGTQIEYEDSRLISEQSVACNSGTDLQICDLFYNIPVRKKFLKQDETEFNQVQALFHAFCLSHTQIHFRLYNEGKLILNAPPVNKIQDRATQIWDHNFSQNLLELNSASQDSSNNNSQSWIQITGCISNHNFWRYGRTHIFFFVNNRWVKNSELGKGLLKGYLNVLPPDKFPAAFVFINIDKTLVDINCHPKKEEVRFLKPLTIQSILQELVKSTLTQSLSKQIMPNSMAQDFANPKTGYEFSANTAHFSNKALEPGVINKNVFTPMPEFVFEPRLRQTNLPVYGQASQTQLPAQQQPVHGMPVQTASTQSVTVQPETQTYKIIGQLFKTYILIENENNFVIIDQHAAHERVIYENLLKNFELKHGTKLLFREFLTLAESQIKSLLECKYFFSDQGIEFEVIGKNDIIIKTSPPKISKTSLKELFMQAIEFIQENEKLDQELFRKKLNEHMHSQIACKSAVKAGDELTIAQMQQLIDDLNKCENRIICVHGRPTTWIISKFDVEKNFKRR
jgi:DNA mismatch repair protein MutL